MGAGPHGKLARSEYLKKHTNVFRFDYNKKMSERRARQSHYREDELVEPTSYLDDTSMVLSPGVNVGFYSGQDNVDGDTDKANGEEPYTWG